VHELLDVIAVEVEPNFRLLLTFENGERRRLDMASWLRRKPFVPLQDARLFAAARVEYGTVVWPGEVDVAPEALYERSVAAG
jgi:hypothetical protein